jgi:hypothetical protein
MRAIVCRPRDGCSGCDGSFRNLSLSRAREGVTDTSVTSVIRHSADAADALDVPTRAHEAEM